MIDLEKIMTWFAVLAGIWLAMFISQQMTMRAVRTELSEMVIPLHKTETKIDPRLPLTANPNLDSIAWCLTHTELMK
jgi:hypothetical protein